VNRAAKRLALLVVGSATTLFCAACGGGGGGISGTPAPPATTGPYSAASLNGTYAFTMTGQDSGGFFARVGSFSANGAGAITAGVEDVNSGTLNGTAILPFSGGSYSISSNGKGSLNLTNQTGTLQFTIVMTSATSGLVTQVDGSASASGNFRIQTPAAFSTANISGGYVFDFSGQDPNGVPESILGQFTANGGGTANGVLDDNDGASASGVQPITGASFAMDPTYGTTFGRGTATIAGISFAFYIESGSKIRFMENSFPSLVVGDATAQTGTIPTTAAGLTGSFVTVMGGASLSGSDVRGGRFTLSGGAVSSIQMDDDSSSNSGSGNSNAFTIPDGTISAATYTVDSTVPGTGRGTLTFTDSKLGTFSFLFYLISPTQAVIQDNSPGIVSDGSMLAQTAGPFTTAGAAGNWVFNFVGQSVNSTTGGFGEEDYLGQYMQTSSASISGGVDFTELSAAAVATNLAITGSMTVQGDGNGRNGYSIKVNSSPSSTLNFSAYFIDANTFFVVGTDTHRTITGTVIRNF
jgi:hypothetical protein